MCNCKYEMHLLMCFDESKNELEVDFFTYFRYLLDKGLNDIENMLKTKLGINDLNKYRVEDFITQVLYQSPNDLDKKKIHKEYYVYNAKCAFKYLKTIFSENLYNNLNNKYDTTSMYYYDLLKRILRDLDNLIVWYTHYLCKGKDKAPINRIDPMAMHNLLRQSIYGRHSFMSFTEYEPGMSAAIIRQIIEVKIRKGLGVVAYINENGAIEPIPMSAIFAELKNYPNIKINPDKTCIKKIYTWSNFYVHSGMSDWVWVFLELEDYLRYLSYGDREKKDFKTGIEATKEDIQSFQDVFNCRKSRQQLMPYVAECKYI